LGLFFVLTINDLSDISFFLYLDRDAIGKDAIKIIIKRREY
jgi:hypothetical protein